ncbi:hypothetical protein [Anaerosinus sp.]|uniref:hypothetical protein n=1 Tax=Selenobaculum sp. TaxID=3074374 RepID=UPI003AB3978D
MNLNIKKLHMEAETVKASTNVKSKGWGTFSISIVNNHNGKRLAVNESLYKILNKLDTVQFMVIPKKGLLLIGKYLGEENSYKLSTTGRPVVYSAGLVESLTEIFELDYTNKTSMSFRHIEIDDSDKSVIAIVEIKKFEVEELEVEQVNKAEANV